MLLAIQETEKSSMPMNESDIVKTVSKQNLFALITSFYVKHMMCQCKQKIDGVLLYRTGTDLGIMLSKTLKLLGNSAMTLLGLAPDKEYSLGETEDNERQLFSFCNKINDRIHQQINTIRKNDDTTPYDISEFNLQLCIDSIDPLLWRMVLLLTRSVSEARKQISIDSIGHQRKLQCLYTLCAIFFNTNRICSVPMHLLLVVLQKNIISSGMMVSECIFGKE